MLTTNQNLNHILLIAIAVVVNCTGFFVTIPGPDGTLYAAIAKHMVIHSNYLELYAEGSDWLDKPHFPFWITAFFFKLFGISSFTYKLPGVLFVLLGAVYTYLLASRLYNQKVATWSVIILLTAEHLIISNNDVRAEPYLVGLIIASVYHFYIAYKDNKSLHLLPASLFAACAIMTKGLFALFPIYGALFGHLLITKDFKALFQLRWLVSFLLVFIFITPELYALWYQFDNHPEKVVFGRTNVSGLRFFFWDSQFGRFFNTGPIKGKGDPFFFLHTTLWAFLPWSILLYAAIFRGFRRFRNLRYHKEWFSFSGALITFLLFSFSGFQLPHYINILFPFFAIITADFLFSIHRSRQKFIKITQHILVILCLIVPVVLEILYQPEISMVKYIPVIMVTLITIYALFNKYGDWKEKVISRSALGILTLNLYMNTILNPDMMKYQSGSEAAEYINRNLPGVPVVQVKGRYDNALEFYSNNEMIVLDSLAQLNVLSQRPVLFLKDVKDTTKLPASDSITIFSHFHITRLTGKFINHSTREEEISTKELRRLN